MAGSYVNPGWTNGAAPALEKTNLDNMSNAIVQNQTDIENLQSLTANYAENAQQTSTNTQDIANLKANILVETNLNIPTAWWQSDTTYASEGYNFSAVMPFIGATADYMAIVTFSPADAASGNFSPTAVATTNGVLVYAEQKPQTTVPIVSVVCLKQTE